MTSLLLLLVFPLVWPFVAKYIWPSRINWTEMVLNLVIVCVLVTSVWELGKMSRMIDTEIWNGQVTAKNRDHGHYVRSYDCNCREECSGSGKDRSCRQVCDTCYEDHYTVKWTADTTVGGVIFSLLDSTSPTVYLSPDPDSYQRCIVGEPASIEHSYINYVQAVPKSLYNVTVSNAFIDKIPSYPRVFDYYRINRVLIVGAKVPDQTIREINNNLSNSLKHLGSVKQVNILVILTDIADASYRYAVENSWLGGKKNDVVVFVGLNGTEIRWADVMTWALNKGNEIFHVQLRDAIVALKTLDPNSFSSTITSKVQAHFDRPRMRQFKYLKEEVEPQGWVIVLAVILAIGGSLALSLFFRSYEIEDIIGNFFANTRKGSLR